MLNILSRKVICYDKENPITVFKVLNNYTRGAKFFDCYRRAINSNINKNKYYQDKWIISTTRILT